MDDGTLTNIQILPALQDLFSNLVDALVNLFVTNVVNSFFEVLTSVFVAIFTSNAGP